MLQATREPASPDSFVTPTVVRHLRQVLLWPLRLISTATDDSEQRRAPWRLLREMGETSPWREQHDEFTGDAAQFHERHYNEFVAFLPYVQRFLYGEGRSGRSDDEHSERSPMRVFRRHDIAAVRVQPRASDAPVTLEVVHIDLYFFYGVDIVLLNVEVAGDDPAAPTRGDFIRLRLVTGAADSTHRTDRALPYAEAQLADFEQRYCYDRFFSESGAASRTH